MGQAQRIADQNLLTLAALVVGTGLAVAARLVDKRRMQGRTARRAARSPFLLAAAVVPASVAGIWLLRRITGAAKPMTPQDLLLAWLNDAYSMETSLVSTLESHSKDAKDHPQIQARIEQHIEQTRRHAELVKSCIERLGGSASVSKTTLGATIGTAQGVSTGAAKDELVKNALAEAAAERFEVAAYTALAAAAQQLGDQETASVCQEILREDEEMAHWIGQNLPMITREILIVVPSTTE